MLWIGRSIEEHQLSPFPYLRLCQFDLQQVQSVTFYTEMARTMEVQRVLALAMIDFHHTAS